MIGHVVVLSRLRHKLHVIWSVLKDHTYTSRCCLVYFFVIDRIIFDWWQLSYDFSIDCTCTINHIVVLSSLHHRSSTIKIDMIFLFHFWRSAYLYDWSRRCLVSLSSLKTHCPISLESSILYYVKITLVWLVMSLSYLLFVMDTILFDQSWQFRSDFGVVAPLRLVISLSCLVFVVDWYFSFIFNMERTCMIGHVVILSYLRHWLYSVWSILRV